MPLVVSVGVRSSISVSRHGGRLYEPPVRADMSIMKWALRGFTARCAREAPAAAGIARPPAGCARLTVRPLPGPWSPTPHRVRPRCAAPPSLYANQAGAGCKLAGPHSANCNFTIPLLFRPGLRA